MSAVKRVLNSCGCSIESSNVGTSAQKENAAEKPGEGGNPEIVRMRYKDNKRFNYDEYTPELGCPVTNLIVQGSEVYMRKQVLLIDIRKVCLVFPLEIPV